MRLLFLVGAFYFCLPLDTIFSKSLGANAKEKSILLCVHAEFLLAAFVSSDLRSKVYRERCIFRLDIAIYALKLTALDPITHLGYDCFMAVKIKENYGKETRLS
jgi:hypothetical protein